VTKTKLVTLVLLAFLVGISCDRERNEPVKLLGVGKQGVEQQITITYNAGVCTQTPSRLAPINVGDTVKITSNVPITVYFPKPDAAGAYLFLPGTPFLDTAPDNWQWSVTGAPGGGPASKSVVLTTRETPYGGNVFYFYYAEIIANGSACVMDQQGMGVQVTR
jgi:hypothetical protein